VPKYYVTCGELKYIGEHKNQHDAAIEALLQKAGTEVRVLPQEIRVSEVGHEPHEDDFIFNTTQTMDMAGFEFQDDEETNSDDINPV
tara:strand:+ start:187 stop:447 length:261 start_codon:yes stop_codon:yes gene_type:complete